MSAATQLMSGGVLLSLSVCKISSAMRTCACAPTRVGRQAVCCSNKSRFRRGTTHCCRGSLGGRLLIQAVFLPRKLLPVVRYAHEQHEPLFINENCTKEGVTQFAEVSIGSVPCLCLEQRCYGILLPRLNLRAASSCVSLQPTCAFLQPCHFAACLPLLQVLAIDICNHCKKAGAALPVVLIQAVEAVCLCRELEQHRPVPTSWKDLTSSLPLPQRVMVYPDSSDWHSLFGHYSISLA